MKKKLLIAIPVVLLASIIALAYYYYNVQTRNAVEQLIKEKKMINILVAGSNNPHENKHTFFAVISINPENYRIGITFIPPAFKIRLDDDGSKVAPLQDVVVYNFNRLRYSLKQDLQLNIPFYIEIYGKDLKRIVNLMEGVNIFVLDQFKDKTDLAFGENYLDGEKVLHYINSVEENSIYLKFDRIQDILFTLYYNKDMWEKFQTIPFINEIMKSVRTNILPQEAMKILDLVFNDGNVLATMVPGGFRNNLYVMDDIAYKIYEKEFLTTLIVDKEVEPIVKIKILNGTAVPGLARKMRNNLIRDGLQVVEFGTSPYKKMKKSIIISRKGNYRAVNKVAETTGIQNIYHIIDNTLLYNVLIIIGEDMAK